MVSSGVSSLGRAAPFLLWPVRDGGVTGLLCHPVSGPPVLMLPPLSCWGPVSCGVSWKKAEQEWLRDLKFCPRPSHVRALAYLTVYSPVFQFLVWGEHSGENSLTEPPELQGVVTVSRAFIRLQRRLWFAVTQLSPGPSSCREGCLKAPSSVYSLLTGFFNGLNSEHGVPIRWTRCETASFSLQTPEVL